MKDTYSSTLTIEIDRIPLRNYLRASRLLLWILSLSFFGVMLGLAAGNGNVERNDLKGKNAILGVIKGGSAGLGISWTIALTVYYIFSHRGTSRYANSLEVTVEGAFLRIREHTTARTDRKLHFRSIVDYTTYQDALMRRFGVHSLRMTTIGGGPGSNIMILGVKDCEEVRDMLSEIDSLRENG